MSNHPDEVESLLTLCLQHTDVFLEWEVRVPPKPKELRGLLHWQKCVADEWREGMGAASGLAGPSGMDWDVDGGLVWVTFTMLSSQWTAFFFALHFGDLCRNEVRQLGTSWLIVISQLSSSRLAERLLEVTLDQLCPSSSCKALAVRGWVDSSLIVLINFRSSSFRDWVWFILFRRLAFSVLSWFMRVSWSPWRVCSSRIQVMSSPISNCRPFNVAGMVRQSWQHQTPT